jgi:hypothetical protein
VCAYVERQRHMIDAIVVSSYSAHMKKRNWYTHIINKIVKKC